MVIENPLEIKGKILSFMNRNGPSLPVQVAREVNLNSIFACAFLSEMISEKRVTISDMKVGGSKLYLIPGQEHQLEKFGESYLKSKEKEAFLLLRNRKFLSDTEQEPAIRVALRQIRDFAFPFKASSGKIYWKFFTAENTEFEEFIDSKEFRETQPEKQLDCSIEIQQKTANLISENQKFPQQEFKQIPPPEQEAPQPILKTEPQNPHQPEEQESQILREKEETDNLQEQLRKLKEDLEIKRKQLIDEIKISEEQRQKIIEQKNSEKASQESEEEVEEKTVQKKPKKLSEKEKFLEEIKNSLQEKEIEILTIESFSKNEATIKVKGKTGECILFAYDKKKVNEQDLMKAYKKSLNFNLPYVIMCKDETPKKVREKIDAYRKIRGFIKI